MAIDSYAEGMSYEAFMKRAFQTNDNGKPGIHLSYLTNLLDKENGESWVSHLPSAKKQIEKVKSYMDKAFMKLIKVNKDTSVKKALAGLQIQTKDSNSAAELSVIIRKALNLTSEELSN
jgi:hypothetical protein